MNICLIHKEKSGPSTLCNFLQSAKKYSVVQFSLYELDALTYIEKNNVDVILLDVISMSDYETDSLFLENIIKGNWNIPVLLATQSNETSKYREKMLDKGVDSCIQLPFLREELFIRLDKLLQKKETLLFSGTKIDANHVEMDIREHTVKTEGEEISLTKTEYGILFHLFLHKNTIVSTKDLSLCLDNQNNIDSHALNIHIFNLRRKIKNMGIIRTVPLYGFMVPTIF